MAKHCCLCLDSTYTPTEHSESIHHRGVAIGTNAGVWVGNRLTVNILGHNSPSQILNVDLVHDSRSGRYDLEVVEGGLSPAQELVALSVALILVLNVSLGRICAAGHINHNRVVNNHFSWG